WEGPRRSVCDDHGDYCPLSVRQLRRGSERLPPASLRASERAITRSTFGPRAPERERQKRSPLREKTGPPCPRAPTRSPARPLPAKAGQNPGQLKLWSFVFLREGGRTMAGFGWRSAAAPARVVGWTFGDRS